MTEFVEFVSQGNVMAMLLFIAFVCLVLGLGVPTTANYVLVATLMAPVVVELGAQAGLVIPLIAVHLFTGIGRPGINSIVSGIAFVVNLVANLVLIPRFGIVGAASASLISYSLSSLLLTTVAARYSGTPLSAFWIPRLSDVRYIVATVLGLIRRLSGWSRRIA